jgi:hypothetical protein
MHCEHNGLKEPSMSPSKRYAKKPAKARQHRRQQAQERLTPTTSPDPWPLTHSLTRCCRCPLCMPSLGSELAVAVPPAHIPSPLTPVHILGEGQALATGRLSSPPKSAEVIHPRAWTYRGPFITPCTAWHRSFRSCSAEGHASSPRPSCCQ